jgi:transposase-like protein
MREATMAVSFKGAHFPPEVILMGVRWYVAYPLSTRHVEELVEERGVEVDHSTINRWVIKVTKLATSENGTQILQRIYRYFAGKYQATGIRCLYA